MQASHKVLFNTGIIYTRALITVLVSLYSTRLIVKALGVQDFGLYSLIGGVVAMLGFFKSALTASTQRFISINIGKGLFNQIRKTVANSIVIHFFVGFLIVIIIEVFGLYMIHNNLIIPPDRINAVLIVFHFVVSTIFITVIFVPFEAILNAYENMLFLGIIGLLEILMRLGVALIITYIDNYDKLILYSILMFLSFFIASLLKWIYCFHKYSETKISLKKDFSFLHIKEHTSFVGWNLFGAACSSGKSQGIAIVSNIFFGPVVNAAYGIANQVKSQSSFFSLNVLRVLNPQIMKSEGANNRERMIRLSLMSCKFGYFLIAFFVIPLIFEMPAIIDFWLGKQPPYVVVFCQLILIGTLVEQLTIGLISAVQSVGNIKLYQITIGGVILLNLPITFFLLKSGYDAEVALFVYIFLEIFAGVFRLVLCRDIVGLPVSSYLKKVFFKVFLPTLFSISTSFLIVKFLEINYRFIITFVLSIIIFFSSSFFSLEENELELLKKVMNKFMKILRLKQS
ncbi:hypothetical protein DUT90_06245 [Polaribacter sp. WD7]|uniref:hypothetical protein n=1 Tax=Polaribacter sp. WD7 TaxID=2269061 RepID=UPI000DF12F69|nr:hypothetical protein [Polaribacter sp. WD7]RCS27703.1 hypothetical protein DUT90_06245 [Polaribacter sp. WD7]